MFPYSYGFQVVKRLLREITARFLLLVLIVVIAAIIVVTIRKRRGNRLLSVMLIVGLVTCGLSLPHVAFANEVTSSHSSTNSIAVNLAGEDYVVGVLVQSQTKNKYK